MQVGSNGRDTDVLSVLLEMASTVKISMMKSESQVIDIIATAKYLGNKSSQLLALHLLPHGM